MPVCLWTCHRARLGRLARTSLTRAAAFWLATLISIVLPGWHSVVRAQAAPPPSSGCTRAVAAAAAAAAPCLTTLVITDNATGVFGFNGLELAAAEADDSAYAALLKTCGPSGAGCTGAQLNLFDRLRTLEDNAAELLGYGETQFSTHLSAQALGFALRWTADEEYSAQGSLTNRLATNQLEAVSNRLSALRFLAQNPFARGDSSNDDAEVAEADSSGGKLGGGASADSDQIGKWSVFANAAYGSGDKAPTTFDDAFSFGATEANVGADVQLSRRMVAGVLLSEVQQHADFNSSESITSGNVKGSGAGISGYFAEDWDAAYVNLSLGVQRMSLETRRVVAYPSNNPQVTAVNSAFLSSTNATSWVASLSSGYSIYFRRFSVQPFLGWQYLGTRIGAFAERGSGSDPEFALAVQGQSITSSVGSLGLNFDYAWSSRFGVIRPFVRGEYRHEFRDQSQSITSNYVNSNSAPDRFELPTDQIDPNYYVVSGGIQTVLPHRIQLYLQYMKVLQLQFYNYYAVSGGFRFDF